MVGGAKPPISRQGRGPNGQSPRSKWSRTGVVFWWRGSQSPPYHLGGLGSAVSSPSWIRGRAKVNSAFSAAAKRFSCTIEAPHGLSWNLLGQVRGDMAPLHPPLKSVYAVPIHAPDPCTERRSAVCNGYVNL